MIPPRLLDVGMRHNRAEYEYIHNGVAHISTAFEIKETIELKLNIPRSLGIKKVCLEIYNESLSNKISVETGEWCGFVGDKDSYIFELSATDIGIGLYFMRPCLSIYEGTLYGHKWAGDIFFDDDSRLTNLLQLTIYEPKYVEPTKIRNGVIYHIFVDRFRRGGKMTVPDGARLVEGEWNVIAEYPEYPGAALNNNTFYGGTLWGIIEKLDYIKSLGTTAIYLSPIFSAASNHKYDTADYMTVDTIFGGEEALKALIKECKTRDIEIILDGVFNHTGCDSIYFNKFSRYQQTGAYQSKKSPYYEWYDFQQHPNNYSSWWGISILPRINPNNPSCSEYFVGDGGVIDNYRKMGIYGFRLDVADELPDEFIEKIKTRLSKGKKPSILYGEVWEDASNKSSYGSRRRYYLGSELDGVMNYPVRKGIIDYLTGKGTDRLAYALTDVTNNAPRRVLNNQMNLLGTHDTERILTLLGGVSSSGKSNHTLAVLRMDNTRRDMAISKLICAYTILATLPGIPTIFYGDEAGLEGYGDPFNRMPFPWGKEDQRLLSHYRRMGNIRREHSIYTDGDFKLHLIDNETLVFERFNADYSYVTLVNNSAKRVCVEFSSTANDIFEETEVSKSFVEPFCSKIFKLKRETEFDII